MTRKIFARLLEEVLSLQAHVHRLRQILSRAPGGHWHRAG